MSSRTFASLVAVASLTAVLGNPAAAQTGQEAGQEVKDCSTAEEIDSPSSAISGGERTEGFHGIVYQGKARLGPDGEPEWAAPPHVEAVYCDSPAHRAGILPGDVIVSVNGRDSKEPGILSPKRPGMTFDLELKRDGEIIEVSLTTVERPTEAR